MLICKFNLALAYSGKEMTHQQMTYLHISFPQLYITFQSSSTQKCNHN
uniref:Uncharacterized protein n=1 Tax=Anguilla anguilla TaxID=7936 RepID=A0A0E9PCQ8_ANGAN